MGHIQLLTKALTHSEKRWYILMLKVERLHTEIGFFKSSHYKQLLQHTVNRIHYTSDGESTNKTHNSQHLQL